MSFVQKKGSLLRAGFCAAIIAVIWLQTTRCIDGELVKAELLKQRGRNLPSFLLPPPTRLLMRLNLLCLRPREPIFDARALQHSFIVRSRPIVPGPRSREASFKQLMSAQDRTGVVFFQQKLSFLPLNSGTQVLGCRIRILMNCFEQEAEKLRGRPLGPVDKYRVRKKYPLPRLDKKEKYCKYTSSHTVNPLWLGSTSNFGTGFHKFRRGCLL